MDAADIDVRFQPDHGTKNAYGFLMRFLDNENRVVTFAQTNVLDKVSCFRRLQKIGMGYLTKSKIKEDHKYTFPNIGTFYGNGHRLFWIGI